MLRAAAFLLPGQEVTICNPTKGIAAMVGQLLPGSQVSSSKQVTQASPADTAGDGGLQPAKSNASDRETVGLDSIGVLGLFQGRSSSMVPGAGVLGGLLPTTSGGGGGSPISIGGTSSRGSASSGGSSIGFGTSGLSFGASPVQGGSPRRGVIPGLPVTLVGNDSQGDSGDDSSGSSGTEANNASNNQEQQSSTSEGGRSVSLGSLNPLGVVTGGGGSPVRGVTGGGLSMIGGGLLG